jgi:predicted P-loop ATPase
MSTISEAFEAASDFERDQKKITPSQQNIRIALLRLNIELRHDVFAGRLLVKEGHNADWSYLDDAAIEDIWLRIDARFGFRPSDKFFFAVIRNIARQSPHHPVRHYLDGLRWDGRARIDTWLTMYGGAEDNAYVREVSRLILTAAVRRVRKPGEKFDEMLILESGQGHALKSSAIAALCPNPDWFSDDLPLAADSKEVIERTSGKWIIEAAELEGIKSGRVEKLKAFLSRQIDVARLAYARQATERPRSFVIVGTTNLGTYLRDLTGNRRFWPVKVSAFDVQALLMNRDQLWAEASEVESSGTSIRLPQELWAVAGAQQEQRRIVDPWEDDIADAYGVQTGKVPAEEVWAVVGLSDKGRRTQEHNARLGAVMKRLGYERKPLRHWNTHRVCPHYVRGRTSEEHEQRMQRIL